MAKVTMSSANKSKEASIENRKLGNDAYAKEDYAQAAELYTMSLICAPSDSPEYALALANRSAAAAHLEA